MSMLKKINALEKALRKQALSLQKEEEKRGLTNPFQENDESGLRGLRVQLDRLISEEDDARWEEILLARLRHPKHAALVKKIQKLSARAVATKA